MEIKLTPIPVQAVAATLKAMTGKKARNTKANGKECPECKGRLSDTEPNVTHMSNPPKKRVHCLDCEYKGFLNV